MSARARSLWRHVGRASACWLFLHWCTVTIDSRSSDSDSPCRAGESTILMGLHPETGTSSQCLDLAGWLDPGQKKAVKVYSASGHPLRSGLSGQCGVKEGCQLPVSMSTSELLTRWILSWTQPMHPHLPRDTGRTSWQWQPTPGWPSWASAGAVFLRCWRCHTRC